MIKELLNNYNSNKFAIERLKQMRLKLADITDDDIPSCTQTLSDMPRGSGVSDSTYNTVAKKETDIEKIDKMIADREQEIKLVDTLLLILKNDDRILINKRHKDGKTWEQIQQEIWTKGGLQLKYSSGKAVENRYRENMKELEIEYKKYN